MCKCLPVCTNLDLESAHTFRQTFSVYRAVIFIKDRDTKRIKILGRIWEQLQTVSVGQREEERGGPSPKLVPAAPPEWVNILNDNAQ